MIDSREIYNAIHDALSDLLTPRPPVWREVWRENFSYDEGLWRLFVRWNEEERIASIRFGEWKYGYTDSELECYRDLHEAKVFDSYTDAIKYGQEKAKEIREMIEKGLDPTAPKEAQ